MDCFRSGVPVILACMFCMISAMLEAQRESIQSGRICIAPLSNNAKARDHDMPDGKPQKREPTYAFAVQIDDREKVVVSKEGKPLPLEGFALGKVHKVRIYDGKEMIESFRFSFENRGGTTLCLSYGTWYQTWILEPPRPGAQWCDCFQKAQNKTPVAKKGI